MPTARQSNAYDKPFYLFFRVWFNLLAWSLVNLAFDGFAAIQHWNGGHWRNPFPSFASNPISSVCFCGAMMLLWLVLLRATKYKGVEAPVELTDARHVCRAEIGSFLISLGSLIFIMAICHVGSFAALFVALVCWVLGLTIEPLIDRIRN